MSNRDGLVDPATIPMREKQFQAQVKELAETLGWWVYHTYDSRRSEEGFVDLVLIRPPRMICMELKGSHGRVSRAQRECLERLRGCPPIEAYVFWPYEWNRIVELLQNV